jgi:hypothetical protein
MLKLMLARYQLLEDLLALALVVTLLFLEALVTSSLGELLVYLAALDAIMVVESLLCQEHHHSDFPVTFL